MIIGSMILIEKGVLKMRYLFISLVLLLSVSSFGQLPVVKDELKTYCVRKFYSGDYPIAYSFNISPDKKWTLECARYSSTGSIYDSAVISVFEGLDTLNKMYVTTFYAINNYWGVSVQIPDGLTSLRVEGGDVNYYHILTHNTWSKNLDTIFIFVGGSTINTDTTGGWEAFAIDISSITGVGIKNPSNNFPTQRVKALNKPNPFRSSTFIQYTIPKSDYVAINIYNNQGRLLRVLKQKYQKAGTHSVKWDGKDNNGNRMANGEYYYQIISGDLITTKKMIFLK